MGDPGVYPGLMQLPYASEDAWRARLTDSLAPGKTDLLLLAELDSQVVASAGLHPVGPSLRRRHAWMPPVAANGVGSVATFNAPSGIAVDAAGNVYVADRGNHRIRKLVP